MTDLPAPLDPGRRTLAEVVGWIDRDLANRCDDAWDRQLPALTDLHARIGEPAQGRFVQQLFALVTARLEEAGPSCGPRLPTRPAVVGLTETDHERIREIVLAGLDRAVARPLPTTGA